VAAENFWGSIAAQIAGNDADVTSIITNPDADPHAYEPTADDARAIASAQLVIENGIGYDTWAQKLLDAESSAGTVLDVGKVVGVSAGGNPHQWYSQASVEKFINRVTEDLQHLDPSHRSDYERNARAYRSTGLAEYSALISQIKHKYAGRSIGASESIVALWATTLGLNMVTPESFLNAVAEGNEPTAADKATVDAQIHDRQIKVFVFNSQNSTPDVQRLVGAARAEHIPVTTVTETLTPAKATFQEWQVRELRALLAALEKASG
jgi:zinc/manganese transport system substrate-binding protein